MTNRELDLVSIVQTIARMRSNDKVTAAVITQAVADTKKLIQMSSDEEKVVVAELALRYCFAS